MESDKYLDARKIIKVFNQKFFKVKLKRLGIIGNEVQFED